MQRALGPKCGTSHTHTISKFKQAAKQETQDDMSFCCAVFEDNS